jgi:hypothetical protein
VTGQVVGGQPEVIRRLESAGASSLAGLVAVFEDLQMVLRCCERLVGELAGEGGASDEVVVEGVWTTALVSYARCFTVPQVALTEDDLHEAQPGEGVLEWHRILLGLREHYCSTAENPRERFTVGVSQDEQGAVSGLAVTSASQPRLDEGTVRQTGALAFALSRLLNDRIAQLQEQVFGEVKETPQAVIEQLAEVHVSGPED